MTAKGGRPQLNRQQLNRQQLNKQELIRELLEEKRRLGSIIRDADKRLQKAPEGQVRIVRQNTKIQFYHRTIAGDTNGKYMPFAEHDMAAALIQKKYDQKILAAAKKQRSAIERFLKDYDPEALKTAYVIQSDVRKGYIIPVELPDQEYRRDWEEQPYEPKAFLDNTPEHFTSRGERVRSKSEVMIADALYRAGIPYKYECPLELGGMVFHPDFTILRMEDRKEIYWEHLGMMDDPEYCTNAIQRIRLYEANSIYPWRELVLSMETVSTPINLAVINRMISLYCR